MLFEKFSKDVEKIEIYEGKYKGTYKIISLSDRRDEYMEKWEEIYSVMSDEELKKELTKFENDEINDSIQENIARLSVLSLKLYERGLINSKKLLTKR